MALATVTDWFTDLATNDLNAPVQRQLSDVSNRRRYACQICQLSYVIRIFDDANTWLNVLMQLPGDNAWQVLWRLFIITYPGNG